MTCEGALAFSHPFAPEGVQDSVLAWASTQTQLRYDQILQISTPLSSRQDADSRRQSENWVPHAQRCAQDLDQSSISSIDDDVSVSDSAHGSSSSEASSQTSWTSHTEFSDHFQDEDGKDRLPQLLKVSSYSNVDVQEQLLRGIHNNEYPGTEVISRLCPIDTAISTIKGGVSRLLRQACPERPQHCAQPLSQAAEVCSTSSEQHHRGSPDCSIINQIVPLLSSRETPRRQINLLRCSLYLPRGLLPRYGRHRTAHQ